MNETQILLASLAMDLKRVAVASYRNSNSVADRFIRESKARKKELDALPTKPHVKHLLSYLDILFQESDPKRRAEDALMYSTLFQNAALRIR